MVNLKDRAPTPPDGKKPAEKDYTKVLTDVQAREKILKMKWHDKVKETYEIYEGGKADETPFNILYSNTEILVPNLFSTAPKPVVRRRFGEKRANDTSHAAERMAEFCMDTNISGYPDFTDAIESAVLDAALPGQGQVRVRVVDGKACIDYVQHTDFIWAYCKRWEDTPWIAYRHDKTVEDAIKEFSVSPEKASRIKRPDAANSTQSTVDDKGPSTIAIYEVWDKSSKQVMFVCEAFEDSLVQDLPDPLNLPGFYPSAKPLRLLSTPVSTMPRSMYGLYKRQADELNSTTDRIKRITQAIRIRGVYDASIPEMASMLDTGNLENGMIPSNNPAGMSREGGLDKHIWLMPVEKLITVLDTLYKIREQIKSTIYEILGIGDILRGVSAASETASAQEIKDKWGSLRIKRSRERVAIFVRAQIRLLIIAAAHHTDAPTWAQITGLPFTLGPPIQPPPMPPGPMQPNMPPPPPSWEQVLGELRDDLTRAYSVDIESNSTVDVDATEDKQEAVEFMTALGQGMAGLQPLVQLGPQGFAVAKVLLLSMAKRFRMGQEAESTIDAMQPMPMGPTPQQQQKDDELKKREDKVAQDEQALQKEASGIKDQFAQFRDQSIQKNESLQNQSNTNAQDKVHLEAKANSIVRHENDLKIREAALAAGILAADVKQRETSAALKEQKCQVMEQSMTHQGAMMTKSNEHAAIDLANQGKDQAHMNKDAQMTNAADKHANMQGAMNNMQGQKDLALTTRESKHGLDKQALDNQGAAQKNTGDARQVKIDAAAPKAAGEQKNVDDAVVKTLIKQGDAIEMIVKHLTQPMEITKTAAGTFKRGPVKG